MENAEKKEDKGMGDNCCGFGKYGGYCCGHGACCGHMGHRCHGGAYHLVKWILKILIVILIFWCGFRLGVLAGSVGAGYGWHDGYGYGYGMMRGVVTPTPAPAQ